MNNNYTVIIETALKGDQRGYETLYNMTKQKAYFVALSISKNQQDSMDILQNSYIKAFGNLRTLNDPEKFEAWLNQIVANESKNYIKKKSPMLFSDMENEIITDIEEIEVNSDYIPHQSLDNAESNRMMMDIINDLEEDKRLVILMHYYQEMSVYEISQTLCMAESAVKYKLLAGRREIKKAVEKLEKEGTKLYAVSPLTILPLIMQYNAERFVTVPEFSSICNYILAKASEISKGLSSQAEATAANTQSAATSSVPTKAFLSTVAGKVTAIAAGIAVISATAISIVSLGNYSKTASQSNLSSSLSASSIDDKSSKDNSSGSDKKIVDSDDNSLISQKPDTEDTKGIIEVPKVTILGVEYKFPMSVDSFMERGWRCLETAHYDEDLRNETGYLNDEAITWLYFKNEDLQYIRFCIKNQTKKLRPIKDCTVIGFSIIDDTLSKNFRKVTDNRKRKIDALDYLKVPNGSIIIGEDVIPYKSTYNEIKAKYGAQYGYDNKDKLWYRFSKESIYSTWIMDFDENNMLKSLQFLVKDEKSVTYSKDVLSTN